MSLRGLVFNYAPTVQLLFVLRGANFQSTSDQQFTKVFGGTNYVLPTGGSAIVARQRTGAASVACAGGIYDAAAKGGNAIVAAGQSWVTLASGVIVVAAEAAIDQTTLFSNTPFLSLTTGSTAAITGDVFIMGIDVT